MKVSIIVPTCGRDWELQRALLSLVNQSISDFEIIVIDDNCDPVWNDKVQKIVAEITKEYPNRELTYIRNVSKSGSAESRNRGIQAAKGEYVTFLDDDDEYLQGKIERQYAFMADNRLDYSITDLNLFYETGRLSEQRKRTYIRNTDRHSLLQYHFMYHMTGTDTIMMRKSYLKEIGGFPPIDYGDEFYLMQRAIEGGGKFGYLEGCDVRAYVHTNQGGMSSGVGRIAGEKQLYAHKKKHFHLLSKKSIRYIRMRHYAVLCLTALRTRKYGHFLLYGMLGVLSAPLQCITLLTDHRKTYHRNQPETLQRNKFCNTEEMG